MNKRRFIASTGPGNTIKLFEAETGSLYRVISVGAKISSQPICTEKECYVNTTNDSGKTVVHFYGLPSCNLIRKTEV